MAKNIEKLPTKIKLSDFLSGLGYRSKRLFFVGLEMLRCLEMLLRCLEILTCVPSFTHLNRSSSRATSLNVSRWYHNRKN